MAGRTHPYLCKYAKPVTSGIDGVYQLLEGTGIFADLIPTFREAKIDIPIKSLSSVTLQELDELHKPAYANLIQVASNCLVFTKNSVTYTIYICLEIQAYVVVVRSARKKVAEILGAPCSPYGPCGTFKLFKYLKKNGLICKDADEYQPPFYGVLDFEAAYPYLSKQLETDVSLKFFSRFPSRDELKGKNSTVVYFGEHNSIEIINLSGDVYIVNVYIRYTEKAKYDFLLKSPHSFTAYEPAFCASSEVFAEFLEDINL